MAQASRSRTLAHDIYTFQPPQVMTPAARRELHAAGRIKRHDVSGPALHAQHAADTASNDARMQEGRAQFKYLGTTPAGFVSRYSQRRHDACLSE